MASQRPRAAPAENYINVAQAHEMIGLRFQIDLHCDQQVAAVATHKINFSERRSMAVVAIITV